MVINRALKFLYNFKDTNFRPKKGSQENQTV